MNIVDRAGKALLPGYLDAHSHHLNSLRKDVRVVETIKEGTTIYRAR